MFPEFETTLYHGTIYGLTKADVGEERIPRDFGRGFYMTASKEAAMDMAERICTEVKRRGRPGAENTGRHLYEITLNRQALENLNIKYFPKADMEWADFVLMCRGSSETPHDYDMVIGPATDDRAKNCMNLYDQGEYSALGIDDAKEVMMRALKPENLGVQYYIGKRDVADSVIEGFKEIEWGWTGYV